jgi:hypothetical protein
MSNGPIIAPVSAPNQWIEWFRSEVFREMTSWSGKPTIESTSLLFCRAAVMILSSPKGQTDEVGKGAVAPHPANTKKEDNKERRLRICQLPYVIEAASAKIWSTRSRIPFGPLCAQSVAPLLDTFPDGQGRKNPPR